MKAPTDVVISKELSQSMMVLAQTAAETTPSCRILVERLADRMQVANLEAARWLKTPELQRIGTRVGYRRDERTEEERPKGTIVHVWPAVEHQHDCYVLVAWDSQLESVFAIDPLQNPDDLETVAA